MKEKRFDDHSRGVLVRGGRGRLSFSFSFSFSFSLSLVSSITQLSHTQLRPVRCEENINTFIFTTETYSGRYLFEAFLSLQIVLYFS